MNQATFDYLLQCAVIILILFLLYKALQKYLITKAWADARLWVYGIIACVYFLLFYSYPIT